MAHIFRSYPKCVNAVQITSAFNFATPNAVIFYSCTLLFQRFPFLACKLMVFLFSFYSLSSPQSPSSLHSATLPLNPQPLSAYNTAPSSPPRLSNKGVAETHANEQPASWYHSRDVIYQGRGLGGEGDRREREGSEGGRRMKEGFESLRGRWTGSQTSCRMFV